MNQGISMIVGSGQVAPSTFVKQMTTQPASSSNVVAGYACQQAVDGASPLIGIAQEGTRYAPTDEMIAAAAGKYTGIAGYTGDPIKVYKNTDVCQLTLGTTVTPQQLLTADANGYGVVATAGQYIGAQAMEGGTSGDLIRVEVQLGNKQS